MAQAEQDTRARLAELGIAIDDAQWEALPSPARKRLRDYPIANEMDRRSLERLVRWLRRTFPPGWGQTT